MRKVLVGHPWTIGLDGSPGETQIQVRIPRKGKTSWVKDYTFDDLLRLARMYDQGTYRITIEEGKLTIELEREGEEKPRTFTYEETKLAIIVVETQDEETGEVTRIPDWFVARMFLVTTIESPEEISDLLGTMKKHRPELYQKFKRALDEHLNGTDQPPTK